STVVLGPSPNRPVTEEARIAGLAWERLPAPKPQLILQIYFPNGQEHVFYLGPHAPHLTPKEIDLLHRIWLQLSNEVAPEELHHHSATVFPGQTRVFNGTVLAINGYSSAMNLTCSVGATPPPSTCAMTPSSVTPTGIFSVNASGPVGDYFFNAHGVGTDANSYSQSRAYASCS